MLADRSHGEMSAQRQCQLLGPAENLSNKPRQHSQMKGKIRRDGGIGDQTLKWLRRLLADALLDNVALKPFLGKKW
ncbi:lysozyme family protein [Bradyrhizobium sp. USDA 4486]